MYLSYYNLKLKPFQMSTDPAFLWMGEKHKEALAILRYAILENKGVLALTGDVGTGKTTLINALLKSLEDDTVTATIYDPRLELIDFFNTIAAAFKIKGEFDGKGQFLIQFMDFLIKTHERNQRILLIIDEAQGINEDLLEEIRLLSNLEAEYTRLLNIFFVGQNEFTDILQKYENRALRQRVSIRYHIEPLTLNETAAYIKYRLKVSGTTAPIFSSGAIDEVYVFSSGYPRLINIMCDHALLSGYVREAQVINANLVRECREELLVSKKSSEKDFQYPADNNLSYLEERNLNDLHSGPNPRLSTPVAETLHSQFTPVDNTQQSSFTPMYEQPDFQEDDPMLFNPSHTMEDPVRHRRHRKRSFFRSPITIAIILLAGIVAGYFFYGNGDDTARSFATSAQQQADKYLSDKSEPKNDQPSTVSPTLGTSDVPGRFGSDNGKDPGLLAAKSPDSGIIEETIPNETGTSRMSPSDQSAKDGNKQPIYSSKPSGLKSDGDAKTMESGMTDATELSSKDSLEIGLPKETARPTAKPVDSVGSNLKEELPVIAPITAKTPDKIEVPAQIPPKTGSTSPVAKADPSGIDKSIPDITPAPITRQSEIQALPPKPVEKPVEKLETVVLAPEPKQAGTQKTIPEETARSPIPDRNSETVASLREPVRNSEQEARKAIDYTNLQARLRKFLDEYCRTYEQKNLDKFSSFFASNAVEKGKPFRSWYSKYRQNFNRIDSMEYNIRLERYATQEEEGLIKIDGIFKVRAKLNGSDNWRSSSGDITLVLEAEGNSFKVVELDY